MKAVDELGLEPFLASDKLDAQLVKCVVLAEATPRGLAEFAQQGKEQEALVEKLLADNDLMKQMLVADGAKGGKYGQAMQIYTDDPEGQPEGREWSLPAAGAGRQPGARGADRAEQPQGPDRCPGHRGPGEAVPALREGLPRWRVGSRRSRI